MSESITAYPISGAKPREIQVNAKIPLHGGNETKNRLEGTLAQREVSLIERPLDQNYVDNWYAFREVGLPVVPTLRESSRGTLLVTDVKADGSEIYGKGLMHTLEHPMHYEPRERPR